MDLNISTLRVFCKVVEMKSFSGASRSLGITQPTVSQQISRVENYLGAKAFERVGRGIFVTSIGEEFFKFAQDLVEKADEFTASMNEQKTNPSGLVRYGLQESCQWSSYYKLIMGHLKQYPEMQFEIDVGFNGSLLKKIKEGDLDFGFIVGLHLEPDLRFELFGYEHYSLVGNDSKLFKPILDRDFSKARLVTFPGWESFAATWFKALGHEAKAMRQIRSTVQVGSLSGAIHAVCEGAGVAVIPTHCVEELLSKNELIACEKSKTKNATQKLHLVTRLGEKHPKRTQVILDMHRNFKDQKPR